MSRKNICQIVFLLFVILVLMKRCSVAMLFQTGDNFASIWILDSRHHEVVVGVSQSGSKINDYFPYNFHMFIYFLNTYF